MLGSPRLAAAPGRYHPSPVLPTHLVLVLVHRVLEHVGLRLAMVQAALQLANLGLCHRQCFPHRRHLPLQLRRPPVALQGRKR